jgi:hypothetical protein
VSSGLRFKKLSAAQLLRLAFIAGAVATAVLLIGALFDRAQFFRSYLFAFSFWLAIPLGSLAILMLQYLTGGEWGWIIRRSLEAAARTLPLIALLFIPILIGLSALYPWAQAEHLAGDSALQHKASYLNLPFFVARAVFYLGVWAALGFFLNRWSHELDDAPGHADPRLRRLSAAGLLLYFITMTFAAIDWFMSIEPDWYSTIYGVLWIVNQGLTALAFAIIALALSEHRPLLASYLRPNHFHDLGNLLLAFVMLWAYMAFSQYLIIWSGNLAEEIPWYIKRTAGGWRWIPPLLIVGHFFLPFLLLLQRGVKQKSTTLAWVAGGILVMRILDNYWLLMPGFAHAPARVHWLDAVAIVGIGGLWCGTFLWQREKRPLLPMIAPKTVENRAVHA